MANSSQFTIIDYSDNLNFTGLVKSNIGLTQTLNQDNGSYTPDWSISPYLQLTPSLMQIGNTSDIIADSRVSTTWYDSTSGTESAITTGTNFSVQNFAEMTLNGAVTSTGTTTSITVNSVSSGFVVGSVFQVTGDSGLKIVTGISSNTITFSPALVSATYANGCTVTCPNPKGLFVKVNLMNNTTPVLAKSFTCVIAYYDAPTLLTINTKATATFALVLNGTGSSDCVVTVPSGNTFKNGVPASVKVHAELYRGASKTPESTSNCEYYWYQQDATVFSPTTIAGTAPITGATTCTLASIPANMAVGSIVTIAPDTTNHTISAINTGSKIITFSPALASGTYTVGGAVSCPYYDSNAGVGWRKFIADTTYVTNTAKTSNEITVAVGALNGGNYAVFKAQVKDVKNGSPTNGKFFYDITEVFDNSDPYTIQVQSSGGDTFKNKSGSSTLTCKVYRHGQELDSGGTTYTYTWTIYDVNGNATTFNGGASSKTGKTLTVGSLDVNGTNTFKCVVTGL